MYQEQLDKLDAKVNDLLALEDKLHLAIEKKTAALSNVALEQGHEFRDDAAGVSIVYGPQLACAHMSTHALRAPALSKTPAQFSPATGAQLLQQLFQLQSLMAMHDDVHAV